MTEAPDQIDQHAPVIAQQDILVNAPLERLWDIHTAVRGWRAWQSDITTLQSSAERLAAGVTFDWSTSGIDIHTTVYRVNEASHETLWAAPRKALRRSIAGASRRKWAARASAPRSLGTVRRSVRTCRVCSVRSTPRSWLGWSDSRLAPKAPLPPDRIALSTDLWVQSHIGTRLER